MCMYFTVTFILHIEMDRPDEQSRTRTNVTKCSFRPGSTPFAIHPAVFRQINGEKIGPGPRGYKIFFMLNSAKHEIFHANKSQINNCKFFLAKHSSA